MEQLKKECVISRKLSNNRILILATLVTLFGSCLIYKGYSDSLKETSNTERFEVEFEYGSIFITPKLEAGMRHITNNGLNLYLDLYIVNNSSVNIILDLESVRNSIIFRKKRIFSDFVKTENIYYDYSDSLYNKNRYITLLVNEETNIQTIFSLMLFNIEDELLGKSYKETVEQYNFIISYEEIIVNLTELIVLENELISVEEIRFMGIID